MSEQTPDILEALLERVFAEGLSEAEWDELKARVSADGEALRRYVEIVHLREGLPYLLGRQPGADAYGTQFTSAPVGDDSRQSTGKLTPSTPPRAFQGPRRTSFARWRNLIPAIPAIPSWAVAAGVAFLVGAALTRMDFDWSSRTPLAERETQPGVHPVTSTPAGFAQESQLGKITGLSPTASADGLLRSMQVGQELRCGEVVQLSKGVMRVQLQTGPELLVEGPAEFSLVGDRSVFIRVGRLTAKGRQRFVLQSPLVTAECLDAEMSFIAEEDASASVYAHDGVVTLRTTPQENVSGEKLRDLLAGQGFLVQPAAPGRLSLVNTGRPSGVVKDWAEVEKSLTDYEQLVLSDHPLAYWPLYRVRRNRRVLDLSQNGFDGLPIGNWPAELDDGDGGSDDRGAYFNGERYIEPDRKPPANLMNGFTVEAWAKPEGPPSYRAIFTSRWVLASHTPNQQCFGFTLYAGDTDRWEFWTGRGVYGEDWNVMESPDQIEKSAWTHVVGTFTPEGSKTPGFVFGVARLYVNGGQVLEANHEASLTDFEWPARIGAAEFVPRSLTSWLFTGRLSDVAVYDYPLKVARIKDHHEAGKPRTSLETSSLSWRGRMLLATVVGGE